MRKKFGVPHGRGCFLIRYLSASRFCSSPGFAAIYGVDLDGFCLCWGICGLPHAQHRWAFTISSCCGRVRIDAAFIGWRGESAYVPRSISMGPWFVLTNPQRESLRLNTDEGEVLWILANSEIKPRGHRWGWCVFASRIASSSWVLNFEFFLFILVISKNIKSFHSDSRMAVIRWGLFRNSSFPSIAKSWAFLASRA